MKYFKETKEGTEKMSTIMEELRIEGREEGKAEGLIEGKAAGLVEGKVQNKTAPGKVVGKIYKTDIKTSIYGVIIPTYNIGGKTAVAIEDLGYDGAFSHIGGKYIWNETDRTISLEFLYDSLAAVSGG